MGSAKYAGVASECCPWRSLHSYSLLFTSLSIIKKKKTSQHLMYQGYPTLRVRCAVFLLAARGSEGLVNVGVSAGGGSEGADTRDGGSVAGAAEGSLWARAPPGVSFLHRGHSSSFPSNDAASTRRSVIISRDGYRNSPGSN